MVRSVRNYSQDGLFTKHGWLRTNARRLGLTAIEAALAYGRIVRTRGAEIFVLGRKEVETCRSCFHLDFSAFEGTQVVTVDGTVVTAYRNRDFRGLRSRRRGRCH
jgi:hypothetical protein